MWCWLRCIYTLGDQRGDGEWKVARGCECLAGLAGGYIVMGE